MNNRFSSFLDTIQVSIDSETTQLKLVLKKTKEFFDYEYASFKKIQPLLDSLDALMDCIKAQLPSRLSLSYHEKHAFIDRNLSYLNAFRAKLLEFQLFYTSHISIPEFEPQKPECSIETFFASPQHQKLRTEFYPEINLYVDLLNSLHQLFDEDIPQALVDFNQFAIIFPQITTKYQLLCKDLSRLSETHLLDRLIAQFEQDAQYANSFLAYRHTFISKNSQELIKGIIIDALGMNGEYSLNHPIFIRQLASVHPELFQLTHDKLYLNSSYKYYSDVFFAFGFRITDAFAQSSIDFTKCSSANLLKIYEKDSHPLWLLLAGFLSHELSRVVSFKMLAELFINKELGDTEKYQYVSKLADILIWQAKHSGNQALFAAVHEQFAEFKPKMTKKFNKVALKPLLLSELNWSGRVSDKSEQATVIHIFDPENSPRTSTTSQSSYQQMLSSIAVSSSDETQSSPRDSLTSLENSDDLSPRTPEIMIEHIETSVPEMGVLTQIASNHQDTIDLITRHEPEQSKFAWVRRHVPCINTINNSDSSQAPVKLEVSEGLSKLEQEKIQKLDTIVANIQQYLKDSSWKYFWQGQDTKDKLLMESYHQLTTQEKLQLIHLNEHKHSDNQNIQHFYSTLLAQRSFIFKTSEARSFKMFRDALQQFSTDNMSVPPNGLVV